MQLYFVSAYRLQEVTVFSQEIQFLFCIEFEISCAVKICSASQRTCEVYIPVLHRI